jgi:hypothetical protein
MASLLRWDFANFFPELVLNSDPFNLCLSSWDYRSEPPHPTIVLILKNKRRDGVYLRGRLLALYV